MPMDSMGGFEFGGPPMDGAAPSSGFMEDGNDAFGMQAEQINDGLDDDEREHLRVVAEEQAERMRGLAEKQTEEMAEKSERKDAAARTLDDWYNKRTVEIENRKKTNKESEWAFL
jgi:hypothetical protein